MSVRLRFFLFVLCWKWAESIETEANTPPTWNVKDSKSCEPTDGELKKVHKVLPKWLPFELKQRKALELVKKLTLQGRSFAGRTEFPWLVELREIPTENWTNSENWANGNLMTGRYVLTTCEAVATFKKSAKGGNAFDEDLGVKNWYLEKKNPGNYKVMYASRYPYVARIFNTKDEIGTRDVEAFFPHPKCDYFVMDYSIGILRVKDQPIWPFPPFTTYMKVDLDCEAFQKLKAYFNSPQRTEKRDEDYCYIGLWSRRIPGDALITRTNDPVKQRQYNQIWNHKVRYVVRWIDPKICKDSIGAFPERMHFQEMGFFECMGINDTETVGVVCDHDRGAPIVCNGSVRAIVLAGATGRFCRNTNPYPFLVIDARFVFTMWTNINAYVLKNTTLLNPRQRLSGASRNFSLGHAALLFVFCIITYLLN